MSRRSFFESVGACVGNVNKINKDHVVAHLATCGVMESILAEVGEMPGKKTSAFIVRLRSK